MSTKYTVDHNSIGRGFGDWYKNEQEFFPTWEEAVRHSLGLQKSTAYLIFRIVKITETPGAKVFHTERDGENGTPVLGTIAFNTEAEAIHCAIRSTKMFDQLYRVVCVDGPPVITREVV